MSWPSGVEHWTQVLVLSECGFESRPGWSRRLCSWARHLTIIALSFGWDPKAVGSVCCVMHVKEPRTIIVKEKWLALVILDSRLEYPAGWICACYKSSVLLLLLLQTLSIQNSLQVWIILQWQTILLVHCIQCTCIQCTYICKQVIYQCYRKSPSSLLKQQLLPKSGILLKTIGAYWSKRRVVTASFFQNYSLLKRQFLHGVTSNSLYLSFSPCKATNLL